MAPLRLTEVEIIEDNSMKKQLFLSLGLIGSLLLSGHISSAEDEIVIDDLSVDELRTEIEKIQNEFYRVFNASIDEEHLKVECTRYTPTSSHISERVCEPKFMVDARNENIRDWQEETDVLQTPAELRLGMQAEFEELTAAMNAVMEESQYFRELNGILRMLRGRMEELDK